jgi:hypothetical protein
MQRSQEQKDKVFASRYTTGPMLKGHRGKMSERHCLLLWTT